jgi:hypothetical protein
MTRQPWVRDLRDLKTVLPGRTWRHLAAGRGFGPSVRPAHLDPAADDSTNEISGHGGSGLLGRLTEAIRT